MGGRILYVPKMKDKFYKPTFGLLYNWFAATDIRSLAASGWRVPDHFDFLDLITEIDDKYSTGISSGTGAPGTGNTAGGYLKKTGFTHWKSPNLGATDLLKFNGKGGGQRHSTGSTNLKERCYFWNTDLYIPARIEPYASSLWYDKEIFYTTSPSNISFAVNPQFGYSIRLLKNSTLLSDGQSGIYTGNDGKIYKTICIGTQEWLADNLCETKFSNNDIIPWYGTNKANFFTDLEWWDEGTNGNPAVCAYDNDVTNVAKNFEFPDY